MCLGVFRSIQEYSGVFRSIQEYSGVFRNIQRVCGTCYVGGVAIEGEDWIGVLGETVVETDVLISGCCEEMFIW
jgi:hypothetical protein